MTRHDHGDDHAAGAHDHVESLNPALEDARHCPRCGATPRIDFPRSLQCAACGYVAFFNPKPVAAAIPREADGRIWLLRRGFDPAAGRWTFPGGFVDLGESVEQAARRECMEEMGTDVTIGSLVGVYSAPDDRIIVVAYEATARDEPTTTEEALEVRAFPPDEIPWRHLAFRSDELALRDLLSRRDGAR